MKALLVTLVVILTMPLVAHGQACHTWPDGSTLQDAVLAHRCLSMTENATVPDQVLLPAGTVIYGNGHAVIADAARFPVDLTNRAVLRNMDPPGRAAIQLYDLVVDARNVGAYGIGFYDLVATRVMLINGGCSGLGIAGKGVVLTDAVVVHNSWPTDVPSRGRITCENFGGVSIGTGIWISSYGDGQHEPVFRRVSAVDNYGPGIECSGAHGGTILDSYVADNISWGGIGLQGCSGWTIARTTVVQTRAPDFGGWAPCYPAYPGQHSAAIMACGDPIFGAPPMTGPTIVNSVLTGYYAIMVSQSANPVVAVTATNGIVSVNGEGVPPPAPPVAPPPPPTSPSPGRPRPKSPCCDIF